MSRRKTRIFRTLAQEAFEDILAGKRVCGFDMSDPDRWDKNYLALHKQAVYRKPRNMADKKKTKTVKPKAPKPATKPPAKPPKAPTKPKAAPKPPAAPKGKPVAPKPPPAPVAPKAPEPPKPPGPPAPPSAPVVTPPPAPKPGFQRFVQEKRNDVLRPKPGSYAGEVWRIADEVTARQGSPALRAEILVLGKEAGIREVTISQAFNAWRNFNGLRGWTSKGVAASQVV